VLQESVFASFGGGIRRNYPKRIREVRLRGAMRHHCHVECA
jgi:hypothetical protein